LVVEFVRRRTGRAPAKRRADGNHVVLFSDILMNDVIGEAGERALSAGKEDFDFVGGRMLLDAVENVGGFGLIEHSEFSTEQLALALGHETVGDLLDNDLWLNANR
jgi:hypothetical protein